MDYTKLRAAALKDGEEEEAVTVDTRALIDKVLARYSGEWTTLRELIQNAADAAAKRVTIKWETLPSTTIPLPSNATRSEMVKHTITTHTLRRLVVSNNGVPFTKTDWSRLKRIAEGNPDETKIGAFGVGFYSVFADCEEPFVSSGHEAMAFYWKGNALFTRKLQVPASQASAETAFVLEYRNTSTPVPNLLSVSQFLATSLTFVKLESMEFWIDEYRILALQKKLSPTLGLAIPNDLDTRTREGMMSLAQVERTKTQIEARFMSVTGWKPGATSAAKSSDACYSGTGEGPSISSFFRRLTSTSRQMSAHKAKALEDKVAQEAIGDDLTATCTTTLFLRVATGSIQTHVRNDFASELERATKKPPPKRTWVSILTSSHDETLASEESSSAKAVAKAVGIFSTVLPSNRPGGRIFIGFPTTQTTGAGMHISAPSVIPTVEREAIDLNARWVRTWNMEMLRMAAIVSRLMFAHEMKELQDKLRQLAVSAGGGSSTTSGGLPKDAVLQCAPEALQILKTYTFGDSTPSGQVAHILEESFWTAFRRASIEVYSSQGVLLSSKVRVASEELGKFVSGIPVVLPQMKDAPLIQKLIDFELIGDITHEDMRTELESKALQRAQMEAFLAWAGKRAVEGDAAPIRNLLRVAVAAVDEADATGAGHVVPLGGVKHYLNSSRIPATMPLPPSTIPLAFTAHVPVAHLQALGWEPLGVVTWIRFLVESPPRDDLDMKKSAHFSAQVLTVVSKNWDCMTSESRALAVAALEHSPVMPTRTGLRRPCESYFPSVKLFDDLPVVQGCPAVKDKVLAALGVRKTVELDTIFTRLLHPTAEKGATTKRWSHVELIKYLASVKDDIPAADMRKLRESRLCPAEAGPVGMEPTKATAQLYKVADLYEPKEVLRSLELPIVQWPGPPGSFRANSVEGSFLSSLGLRPFPGAVVLLDLMASPDVQRAGQALTYFISNHHMNGYASAAAMIARLDKPILPVQGDDQGWARPADCYTDAAAAVLGYKILRKDLHVHAAKLAVARDPPIGDCVRRFLARPPQDRHLATQLYSYFATRLADLDRQSLAMLRKAEFVPVMHPTLPSCSGLAARQKAGDAMLLVRPDNVYLGQSTTYGDIFDFVDFGENANTFLFKCGAKTEPSKIEIATLACAEPARLLGRLQSPDKYLHLLRTLAEDLPALTRDRVLFKRMRASPFLLGFEEISPAQPPGPHADDHQALDLGDEDEKPIKQYHLAKPSDIVILDDYIAYRLFKSTLRCAPEEDTLEDFYLALGSENLGSLVQSDFRFGDAVNTPRALEATTWLRSHVIERSKIFLHEFSRYRNDAVKHDAKWLESQLDVQMVRSVTLKRSLRGRDGRVKTHTEQKSAAMAPMPSGREQASTFGSAAASRQQRWTLYVANDGNTDMYQVGQALCGQLLNRPNQQAYFFFEPFLKLDLLGLRSRGYNVDRILRAKAAEARIAEEERRKARAEEEALLRKALEDEKQARPRASELGIIQTARMPGSFDDSPPRDKQQPDAGRPSDKRNTKAVGSILSQWSKRLGLDSDPSSDTPAAHQSLPAPTQQTQKPGLGSDDGRVTSPAVVQQNLLKAISSTRAHDANSVFSKPTTRDVKEQATYCDATPARNLALIAQAPQGTNVFVVRDLTETSFLQQFAAQIGAFESLLLDVGAIYNLPSRVLHIFYDDAGGTIAFNRTGSIFCNLRFFAQLHHEKMRAGWLGAGGGGQAKAEAATWWWVVLAHELAHNIVEIHDAEHSFYTGSFIQLYFGKMMTKAATWMATSNNIDALPSSYSAAAAAPSPGGNVILHPQRPPPYALSDPDESEQRLLSNCE